MKASSAGWADRARALVQIACIAILAMFVARQQHNISALSARVETAEGVAANLHSVLSALIARIDSVEAGESTRAPFVHGSAATDSVADGSLSSPLFVHGSVATDSVTDGVRNSEVNPARLLAEVAQGAPSATLRIDVKDPAGVSQLVFGQDGAADRISLQHDVQSFALLRNASKIVEVDSQANTHISGAAIRIHAPRISLENRRTIFISEVDQANAVWNPANVTIYVGDTVTWIWSSLQNVVEADASYASREDDPNAFSSGIPTLRGSFSVRFDRPGVYYYKSQNTNTLRGTVTVNHAFELRDGKVTAQFAGLVALKMVRSYDSSCPTGMRYITRYSPSSTEPFGVKFCELL